jgi:hypothetical protein
MYEIDWVRERGWRHVAAFTFIVLPVLMAVAIVGRQLVSN